MANGILSGLLSRLTRGGSGRAAEVMAAGMPWKDDPAFAVINFAAGDLVTQLPTRLTIDGRLHAETLLAVTGAIAGYAAQRALFSQFEPGQPPGTANVQTKSGDTYYFGDALNRSLLGSPNDAAEHLWPLAAGGAVAAGLPAKDVPPVDPFFAHVAQSLGGDNEGLCSLPNCQFAAPVRSLLKAAWPLALQCFNSELSGAVIKPHTIVPQRWRPVIAGNAVNVMVRKVAGVLSPLHALTIVMESAIYASKLPPSSVESG